MALKRCIDKECITTWALGDHCPKCGLGPDGSKIAPTYSKIAPKYVASKTELAAELSDSELLRKIAKHSEESAFVLKRFLFVAQVFAALWFIGMIIQFIQAAN